MPTSLTATKIKDTYGQVLHVDGGVTSTPKTVYDGDGTASALKVSTTAVEVPVLGISGGTANGVAYLNGSKVLTTGSALTFNGTTFGLSGNQTVSGADGLFVSGAVSGSSPFITGGNLELGATASSALIQAYNRPSFGAYNLDLKTTTAFTFSLAGSEQMRLTSTGLGIGTSSPSRKLELASNIDWQLRVSNGTSIGSYDIGRQVANGYLIFSGNQAGATGYIFGGIDGERMRIDSSGNVLVGTTSLFDNAKASIQTNSSNGVVVHQNASGGYCYGARAASNGGTYYLMYFQANTTDVGGITSNGTGTTYATTSDYRLKENIQPMQNALDVVAQLNPVTYTWKADGSDGQGFIAHELQAVVPDCVTGEKDAVDKDGKPVYQGVDTSFLVATLTKAIQEQQEQINQLKAEVAALKGN